VQHAFVARQKEAGVLGLSGRVVDDLPTAVIEARLAAAEAAVKAARPFRVEPWTCRWRQYG
jgi:hypothetical protein